MDAVEISLTQGMTALVDEVDVQLVRPYKWHVCRRGKACYAATMALRGRGYYMHRLIVGATPDKHVDHRNGNGLDNRRANLRLCSNAENRRNMRVSRGKSRFKGVALDTRQPGRPWIAYIDAECRRVRLGSYATEVEAARAYNATALQLHGEFASLNLIEGLSYEESVTAPVRNRKPGRPCRRAVAGVS